MVNLVSFSVIAGSYCGMYRAARTSSAAVRSDQQVRESSMARKMTLIVVTDAACWLPIILLGLLSLAGVIIPPQVSSGRRNRKTKENIRLAKEWKGKGCQNWMLG